MRTKILHPYLTTKRDNTTIELISSHSLTYDNTNLPKRAFSFKTHQPLFWKLKQKHFDSTSGTLVVEVVEYNSLPYNILTDDVPEYQINYLSFEKLDWPKFEPLLFSYTLSQLKDSIFNYRDKLLDLGYGKNDDTRFLKRTDPNLFFAKREPDKQEKEFEVKVKYEDAKFDISKICFSVNLKPYKVVRQLEIGNLHLKPEFEYIKPYIVKGLANVFG
ncbi:MAG: hypothetical protein IPL54_16925 [Chitinophagaceae bacterium]|nr:hypothetical protein [Chitinophagaceae bacterium]